MTSNPTPIYLLNGDYKKIYANDKKIVPKIDNDPVTKCNDSIYF